MNEKWGNPQQKLFGLPQFLMWFTFFATMLSVALLTARFAVVANLFFNVVCGVLVLVFCKPVMFERLKLTTLLTLRGVIALFVIFKWNGDIYTDLVRILLVINILEATFTNFLKNKQYLNGVSGIALAVGVIGLTGSWDIENEAMYHIQGAILASTICYAIGYTIWNWIFVSGEFSPSVTLMHVGFLTAPIVGSIIMWAITKDAMVGWSLWLLFRANTLTFGGIMQIGAKNYWEENLHNDKFSRFVDFTHKTWVQVICMIICIALMAAVIVLRFTHGSFVSNGGFLPF